MNNKVPGKLCRSERARRLTQLCMSLIFWLLHKENWKVIKILGGDYVLVVSVPCLVQKYHGTLF